MSKHTWTIEEAQRLAARLEPIVAAEGWHVGLNGSVLTKGFSDDDLDLTLYKHTPFPEGGKTPEQMAEMLAVAGLLPGKYKDPDHTPSSGHPSVYPFSYDGRRVDVFFMEKIRFAEPEPPKLEDHDGF